VTHVFSPDLSRPADSAILARIAADLTSGDDLRGLLQRFLEPIMRLANAQAGAVRVLCPGGDRMELVSAIGLPTAIHEAERLMDSHCGFCGEALEGRRVVWAVELDACSRQCGSYFGNDCRRVLAVPLMHKGRVLGLYNLFFASDEELAPDIAAVLRSIGELLGLALDNLRLEAENMRATVMHERQAMAAEVHDSVAQNLTFIKMRLPLLRDAILADDQERALKFLDDIHETAGEAHGSLREIVTQFRTRIDPRGLGRAFDALAKRFCTRTGIELQLANRMPALRLGENEELDVFHIVQEALVNIERHSRARHAWLSIEPTLSGVVVKVEDDGVGPQPRGSGEAAGAHYGIDIMSERARRLHGELRVTPREGGGTQVRLAVPIPKTAEVAA